ncbi:hypothetical protein FKW77_006055 [Venturia effusa]|uniref:Uncharacterized protein n=1 Tax=Venturia effusa TaxID=50376 RepID=A0A517L3E6_9PEZI|nr:hypothetical protein FKW77_006055 [Venturia effusa]
MERNSISPTKTPRDKYTPSPRPFIHFKRRSKPPHSSPFTSPSSPKYRISWFHGRLASKQGHEITKAAAARMSRKQLVDADWEKHKEEMLEVATEANAHLAGKRNESSQDVQTPYDPNSGPSTPIPAWLLFPKSARIRKRVHSPLHQTSKSSASQIRKNLIRSPSRRQSQALVFEEMQTPNKPTPTRSTNWKMKPLMFTAGDHIEDLETELRTTKVTVKDLSQRLEDVLSRNKDLESVSHSEDFHDDADNDADQNSNSFLKDSLKWCAQFIQQSSRCYIIFHLLCYCASKLRPD